MADDRDFWNAVEAQIAAKQAQGRVPPHAGQTGWQGGGPESRQAGHGAHAQHHHAPEPQPWQHGPGQAYRHQHASSHMGGRDVVDLTYQAPLGFQQRHLQPPPANHPPPAKQPQHFHQPQPQPPPANHPQHFHQPQPPPANHPQHFHKAQPQPPPANHPQRFHQPQHHPPPADTPPQHFQQRQYNPSPPQHPSSAPPEERNPLCPCGAGSVLRRVSRKPETHGRAFFCCPKPQGEQCRFFAWCDSPQARQLQPAPPSRPSLGDPTTGLPSGSAVKVALQVGHVENAAGGSIRVYLSFAGHNEAIDSVVRAVEDHACDAFDSKASARKLMHVPIDRHDELCERLRAAKDRVRVDLTPLPVVPLRIASEASKRLEDGSERYDKLLPRSLERHLYAFQRDGVKFALSRSGRVLIGDEMGLGKTIQAIATVACYPDDRPCLVVCPASLRHTWADNLNEWLGVTDSRMAVIDKPTKAMGHDLAQYEFVVLSYEAMDKLGDDIKDARFASVICDEAHYLKSPTAKRTKATIPIIQKARRAILLSGTPALAKPKELLNLIKALHPKAIGRQDEFYQRYCVGPGATQFDPYGGACNIDELHALLKGAIMIRRMKKDVLTQLPAIQRARHILALDAASAKMLADYKKKMGENRDALDEFFAADGGGGGGGAEQRGMVMELYKESAVVKTTSVQAHIKELLQQAEDVSHPYWKLIIFAHHKPMMDAIETACRQQAKVNCIRIDGSTPSSQRARLVQDFQTLTKMRVALLSIKAAGVGLTLTAASTVVFAEMSWTPGDIKQAEGRAHRIGQTETVNVQFLIAKGTIDDLIWRGLSHKLNTLGNLLDGQQATEALAQTEEKARGGAAHGAGGSSNGIAYGGDANGVHKRKRPSDGSGDRRLSGGGGDARRVSLGGEKDIASYFLRANHAASASAAPAESDFALFEDPAPYA